MNTSASNSVTTFNHPLFGEVRTVEQKDSDVWFVAKDVAESLGYTDTSQAIRKHCKGGVKMTLPTSGGSQQGVVIPERDVYRLIMRSKLPAAEQFEEWVVSEVLPSIRKTGGYGVQAIDWSDTGQVAGLLSQSLEQVQKQQRTIEHQAEKIKTDKPKVSFYEQYANHEGLYTLQNAGRLLTGKPNKFIQGLKGQYLFYQGTALVAKVKYTEQGLFEVKATIVEDKARMQTYVTPKGIQYFAKKLGVNVAA